MQVIRSCSNIPGFNLAAEEYLFSQRQDEILFLYVNAPCVVIGCNQALHAEVDTEFCLTHSIPVYRRISGGGAVYHDKGNINYCYITNRVPGKYPLGAAFLEPIVRVLHGMNIPVEVGQRKDIWLPGPKKISGTASHVGKDRELHHGTLLYDTNLENLQAALSSRSPQTSTRAIASVPSPVKNIRTWLSEQGLEVPVSEHFFSLLLKQLLDYHRQDSSFRLSESETVQIEKLFVSKYESKDWNYRK